LYFIFVCKMIFFFFFSIRPTAPKDPSSQVSSTTILWQTYQKARTFCKWRHKVVNLLNDIVFFETATINRGWTLRLKVILRNVIVNVWMASSTTWPPSCPSSTTSSPSSTGSPSSDWPSHFSGQNHTSKVRNPRHNHIVHQFHQHFISITYFGTAKVELCWKLGSFQNTHLAIWLVSRCSLIFCLIYQIPLYFFMFFNNHIFLFNWSLTSTISRYHANSNYSAAWELKL